MEFNRVQQSSLGELMREHAKQGSTTASEVVGNGNPQPTLCRLRDVGADRPLSQLHGPVTVGSSQSLVCAENGTGRHGYCWNIACHEGNRGRQLAPRGAGRDGKGRVGRRVPSPSERVLRPTLHEAKQIQFVTVTLRCLSKQKM